MVFLKGLRTKVGSKAGLIGAIFLLLTVIPVSAFAVTLPTPVLADGVQLLKGPYVQKVTTTSAVVRWEASDVAVASFEYGVTPQYGSAAPIQRVSSPHERVQLSDLEPYTKYFYSALGPNGELLANSSFVTLAGSEQDKISFVAWGDNRTNHQIHGQLASMIADAAPDFVLNVGDLVESGLRQSDWDMFFKLERELLASAPVFSALGNHELNSPLYFSLFSLPGNERWYSFDSGPAHFIGLDVVFSEFGPGSEQYRWLVDDLKQTDRPWKIVFMHYPPYSFNERGGVDTVKTALTPLFEQYGVQLVFGGHNHHYQRNVVNGVTYVVTGGGGAPLHPVGTSSVTKYGEQTYEFTKLLIDGGTLVSTGVRLDGTEFDSFSLSLPTEQVLTPSLSSEGLAATSDVLAKEFVSSTGSPIDAISDSLAFAPTLLQERGAHISILVPGGLGGIVFALAFVGVRRSRRGKNYYRRADQCDGQG